jgi:hypothetical protein
MKINMKKTFILILLIPALLLCAFMQVNNPQAEIKNELIQAKFYLPDAQSGYYRGTRFDWSGVMPSLEYKGHSYFGQWNDTYEPTLHDAIMGPVEEFAPLGYEKADSGGNFVKIGIGVLHKPAESKYDRFNYYQIEDPGIWTINKKSDQITFIHDLGHKDYGYQYTKTVRLVPGKPVMEIEQSIKNKGQQIIETSVYDHNFFVMDGKYTGPGFLVTFPFDMVVDPPKIGDNFDLTKNTISFKSEFIKGETTHLGLLTGYSNDMKDYDFRIENRLTGAGVRIKGDKPLTLLIFWASQKVLSPEPYINIKIEPGQEFTWKITYEFYTFKTQH